MFKSLKMQASTHSETALSLRQLVVLRSIVHLYSFAKFRELSRWLEIDSISHTSNQFILHTPLLVQIISCLPQQTSSKHSLILVDLQATIRLYLSLSDQAQITQTFSKSQDMKDQLTIAFVNCHIPQYSHSILAPVNMNYIKNVQLPGSNKLNDNQLPLLSGELSERLSNLRLKI